MIFISALISLLLAPILPSLTFVSDGIREGAFRGVYGEKNAAARLNAFALLMYIALPSKNKITNILALSSLLVVIMTKSVTALIILMLGVFTYFVLRYMFVASKGLLRLSFLYISIYASFLIVLKYLSDYILLFLGRDPDLTDRIIIWELLSTAIYSEFSFGYGFGAFWGSVGSDEFIERWGYIGNAHNGYFEILLAGGVFLLLPFLLLSINLFSSLIASSTKLISNYVQLNLTVMSLTVLFLMYVVNFVAFIIPNHRSAEMMFFLLISASFFVRNKYGNA